MQLFLPKTIHDLKHSDEWSWKFFFWRLILIRTWVGFTIGEALVWFGFVVIWPLVLGLIYFYGGFFVNASGFFSVKHFVLINVIVVSLQSIFIIPFWWLMFSKLKQVSLYKRILLHIPGGCIYSGLVIIFYWQIKEGLIQEQYNEKELLSDLYNSFASYTKYFIVFHAYNFWLSIQRQNKKEQQLRELNFQSEINALKTQIEPHFLFNTLNSISASVPPSLEKTRILIAQLADTFRYALRVNESRFVTLGEELEFMKTWLALEQQRFGPRLKIYYEIDDLVLNVLVPPMLLQPLVENALNHGIAEKLEGGSVTITCKVKPNNLIYIAVSDTGVGCNGDLDEIMNKGVGLSNTAKRLHLLYNKPLYVDRQKEGLIFSFNLPMNDYHEKKSYNY